MAAVSLQTSFSNLSISEQGSANLSIKDRAYQTFGGTDFVKHSSSLHLKVLYALIYSEAPENVDSTLVEKVFSLAEEDLKNYPIREKSNTNKEFPTLEDSDEEIPISYGGGKNFLHSFLYTNHLGYASEGGGQGMFVTIDQNINRDVQYAFRTPLQHFDDPVTMTAKIAKRYLLRVNDNSYEAVVPQTSTQYLKEVKVSDVDREVFKALWDQNVADLMPVLPISEMRDPEAALINKLTKTGKYTEEEVQVIVQHFLPLYPSPDFFMF